MQICHGMEINVKKGHEFERKQGGICRMILGEEKKGGNDIILLLSQKRKEKFREKYGFATFIET